jgi:uncharacterized protein YjiS (DUF1127 family)
LRHLPSYLWQYRLPIVQRNKTIPTAKGHVMSRLFHAIAARFADWRSRQRALAELSALDDRSLADIGLTRAEIPYVLSRPQAEPAPAVRPATAPKYRHAA